MTTLSRWLLGVLAFTWIIRGVSYLPIFGSPPGSLPPGLDLISTVVPITAWGTLWVISGVIGIFTAVTLRARVLATMALTGIAIVWTLAYVYGWIDEGGRGYLNATTYLGLTIGAVLAVASLWEAEPVPELKSE